MDWRRRCRGEGLSTGRDAQFGNGRPTGAIGGEPRPVEGRPGKFPSFDRVGGGLNPGQPLGSVGCRRPCGSGWMGRTIPKKLGMRCQQNGCGNKNPEVPGKAGVAVRECPQHFDLAESMGLSIDSFASA